MKHGRASTRSLESTRVRAPNCSVRSEVIHAATGPGYVTIITEAEGKSFGVAATVELPEGTLDENDGANE